MAFQNPSKKGADTTKDSALVGTLYACRIICKIVCFDLCYCCDDKSVHLKREPGFVS